jgi:hypothetical protein
MSINAEYGTITWTPSAPDTVDIAIVASLASDASISAEQSYRLRVVAANANPVRPTPIPNDTTRPGVTPTPPVRPNPSALRFVTAPPSVTASVGREYVYRARAEMTTPTTASVQYALGRAPEGASIDARTGELRWTPRATGRFDIEIIARLANGERPEPEARQLFTVTVAAGSNAAPPGNVNATPTIRVAPNPVRDVAQFHLPSFAGEGKLSILNVRGEEIWSASVRAENSPISWQAGATQPGAYVVRLVAERLRAEAQFIVAR